MNALESKALLRVFYELVLGINSPTEIARNVRKVPSAIIHQLNNVQTLGIVVNKNGSYSVDWDHVVKVLLENAPLLKSVVSLPKLFDEVREIPDMLKNNETFRDLVKSYYVELATAFKQHYFEVSRNIGETLKETFAAFELSLLQS